MSLQKSVVAAMIAAVLPVSHAMADSKTVPSARVQYNISNVQTRGGDLPSNDTIGWVDARVGIQTYQPMDNGFAAFGIVEFDVTSNTAVVGMDTKANTLGPRYVFGGVDMNEYGKVTFGRVGSGLLDLVNLTDFFAFNGGGETIAARAGVLDASAGGVTRQDNTLGYENTIAGVKFTTAYIMNSGYFSTTGVDKGYNFSLSTEFGNNETGRFKPVFAYQKTDAIKGHNSGTDKDPRTLNLGQVEGYEFWGVGAEYYIGDYGVSVLYTEDKLEQHHADAGKNRGVESMLRYTGFDKLDLRFGYFWQENTAYGDDLINDFVVDAHYSLTSKTRLIAEYSFRNADEFGAKNGQYFAKSGNKQEDFFYLAARMAF